MKVPGWVFIATVVGLALGLGLMFRSLFPKTVVGMPRIVTQYDTVRTLDTAWVTRIRKDTIRVNVLERITVAVPETVLVIPETRGFTALSVGRKVGDSTLVAGFTLSPLDTGYTRRDWLLTYYTTGPLKSLALNPPEGTFAVNFYDPPKPSCGAWCKIGHYALGAAVGAGATALACTVTR